MKKTFLFLFAITLIKTAGAQSGWQQKVDYTIDVSLRDGDKTLDAFEHIVYQNNSPDTLRFIWFHLWPNAYKNDRTAFSDQLLENGSTAFYFSNKESKGYINRLDFKVDGAAAKTEDHPAYIDVIKLLLPTPLAPGKSVSITTPFHVKLPYNFSRGGYDGESFQITQWYPKPAVYDKAGWHPMPYLDQGEFYSEFGDFNVKITVPSNYAVAATGELQEDTEKAWLINRANYSSPIKTTIAVKSKPGFKKKPSTPITTAPATSPQAKTITFQQTNVHDFAFFVSKEFVVQQDSCKLPSGRIIQVATYYTPAEKKQWSKALQYAKDGLRFYSTEVGEYPYNTATVVQGPQSFGGGMEYPTITVISPTQSAQSLEGTVVHELGHNWFYGILASNERDHPWMDEGMNTFYESRYLEMKYGPAPKLEELIFQAKAIAKTDQPIETTSEEFSATNYELVAYHKTAEWMRSLQQKLGDEGFRNLMHYYFDKWKFRHPQPADFTAIIGRALGDEAEKYTRQLSATGALPGTELKGTTVLTPVKKGSVKAYLLHPTKNVIAVSPALGYNVYDGLMVGGAFANYGLHPAPLRFFAAPFYATGSATVTGIGNVSYTTHSNGKIRTATVFGGASHFTINEFKPAAEEALRMKFTKATLGVRLTLKEPSARSTVKRYVQFKTYAISEQSLRVKVDSIFRPTDTLIKFTYTAPSAQRYLNQLLFVYQNTRVLYPFDVALQVEQAQDFLRTTVTTTYFFNYAKGGGMQVRLFGGKFSYLNGKTVRKQFANDRYFLNLTGPKGDEDYTYSNYFLGRNRFEGLPSQQLMVRDGAFKVRTDLLASKVGKTDDWLASLNLVSSIPKNVNPLSVLPFRLPLQLFADVGTYAEAWQRSADADRFLFDAGLALPVAKGALTIWVPLVYSKVYGDYFKSTIPTNRFLKTISFSIDFSKLVPQRLNRELEIF